MGTINQIATNNGNFCRIFINTPFFGIEGSEDGLTNFTSRQNRAFDLDTILDYAHSRGVYVQLCLEDVDQFSPQRALDSKHHTPTEIWGSWWNSYLNNPYSSIEPNNLKFFTNPSCIRTYQKRLRYIIARWGYSTNIFAFEFFNEIDKISNASWGYVGNLINWIKIMTSYCKSTLGDDHLYTCSLATPEYATNSNFVVNSNIDFFSEHFYTASRNQDHQINYLANRGKYLLPEKPYLLQETGGGFVDSKGEGCYFWVHSYVPNSSPFARLYDECHFHDALWASVFSGSSGATAFWENGLVNRCWGGQLQYFLPLVKFLQGEDLNLSHFIAITNSCLDRGSGVIDGTFVDPETSCIPNANNLVTEIPLEVLNATITTSDDENVEVFALHYYSGDKLLGWVKNKNNWWYNLPHDDNYCADSVNPHLGVVILNDVEISIHGLRCDAVYQIEFYSTYPKYDINGHGPEDGGKINAFTTTSTSHCGVLTFKIPQLIVLRTSPYAPDYAFKITVSSKLWGHSIIGPQPAIQPFAITGDGSQIAYRGTDGKLNCFYTGGARRGSSWANTVLSPGGANSVKPNGAIARGSLSGQIYYHGADDRLQCTYWNGISWAHTYLTDWSNSSQNVGGDIISNDVGGKIFYRGIDGKLHHYYWEGGSWRHEIIFFSSFDLIATDSNLAEDADGGLVAYKAIDGKLHMIYKSSGVWYHDYSPTDSIGGFIRINNAGNVVFYRGTDGKLHEYYYLGSGWHSRVIITSSGLPIYLNGSFDITPDCTYDNAQIYFRGSDGHIHVVYVWAGQWIEGHLMCTDFLDNTEKCKNGGYIRVANGMVVYDAVSNYLEAYYFGMCGNIKAGDTYGPRDGRGLGL